MRSWLYTHRHTISAVLAAAYALAVVAFIDPASVAGVFILAAVSFVAGYFAIRVLIAAWKPDGR